MTWTDFKPQTLASLHKRLSRRPYADHAEAFISGARAALSAWTRHTHNLPAMQDRIAAAEGLAEAADAMLKRIKTVRRSRVLEAIIDAELVFGEGARRLSQIAREIEALAGAAHRMAGNFRITRSEIHPMLREKAMVSVLAQVWRQTMRNEPSATRGSTFEAICVEVGKNEFDLEVGPASMKAAKKPA
jgi:hypothetical protein